jgi:hypothetical protein
MTTKKALPFARTTVGSSVPTLSRYRYQVSDPRGTKTRTLVSMKTPVHSSNQATRGIMYTLEYLR